MDNLDLWHAVEKTDPGQVKPITGKSYGGTSPKPHYLVLKATETFGPCGIGWGYTIVDERIEDAGAEKLSIARVRVWYKWKGERGEVEHVGGTQFSGVRSSGKPFADEDAPKKSVTDALVKALSMIGFAGDIFMGRYDDSKYVNELREEARQAANSERNAAAEKAPSQADTTPFDDEAETQTGARARLMAEWKTHISKFTSTRELSLWWNGDARKKATKDFDLVHDDIKELKEAVIARKAEIERRAAA
jgi:hypothetical protein